MPKLEILNNIDHQNLKVLAEYSAELGDNLTTTPTFITEYAEVQKEYPILFSRDKNSGEFQSLAFLGFVNNENLFLSEPAPQHSAAGWSAQYIPATMARGPFSIVYQKQREHGADVVTPMIQVDVQHPKISTTTGRDIFLEQGGNSAYLDKVAALLNIIRDGWELNKPMFAAFAKHNLIETLSIDIDLANGEKHHIGGFYTIDAEKLNALDGAALKELAGAGFLQAAYFVVASLSNLKRLIDIKNRQLVNN